MSHSAIVVCLLMATLWNQTAITSACRVNSELLKSYTRDTIENLLDVHLFESLYWPDEPLDANSLAKATGINVTLAETHFQIEGLHDWNEIVATNGENSGVEPTTATPPTMSASSSMAASKRAAMSLIQDIFVTCAVGRDRSYALAINLELDNPFKTVDLHYEVPTSLRLVSGKTSGQFQVSLPQSSLLVQLSQRIRYDECLTINHVQLAPSVSYEIECASCDEQERAYLDNAFGKRMTQFDAELDSLIGEKLLYGLQVLLNQQRLELAD